MHAQCRCWSGNRCARRPKWPCGGVAHAHYEVVLVAVAQQGIVGGDVVDEVDGGARKIDHIDVDEVEGAACAA